MATLCEILVQCAVLDVKVLVNYLKKACSNNSMKGFQVGTEGIIQKFSVRRTRVKAVCCDP